MMKKLIYTILFSVASLSVFAQIDNVGNTFKLKKGVEKVDEIVYEDEDKLIFAEYGTATLNEIRSIYVYDKNKNAISKSISIKDVIGKNGAAVKLLGHNNQVLLIEMLKTDIVFHKLDVNTLKLEVLKKIPTSGKRHAEIAQAYSPDGKILGVLLSEYERFKSESKLIAFSIDDQLNIEQVEYIRPKDKGLRQYAISNEGTHYFVLGSISSSLRSANQNFDELHTVDKEGTALEVDLPKAKEGYTYISPKLMVNDSGDWAVLTLISKVNTTGKAKPVGISLFDASGVKTTMFDEIVAKFNKKKETTKFLKKYWNDKKKHFRNYKSAESYSGSIVSEKCFLTFAEMHNGRIIYGLSVSYNETLFGIIDAKSTKPLSTTNFRDQAPKSQIGQVYRIPKLVLKGDLAKIYLYDTKNSFQIIQFDTNTGKFKHIPVSIKGIKTCQPIFRTLFLANNQADGIENKSILGKVGGAKSVVLDLKL